MVITLISIALVIALVALAVLFVLGAARSGKEQDEWARGAILLDAIERGEDVSRL